MLPSLPPAVGARVLAAVVLRSLGGEGSGNFGHAGRPGEVGGSGAGGNNYISKESVPFNRTMVDERVRNGEATATELHPSEISKLVYTQKGTHSLNIKKLEETFEEWAQAQPKLFTRPPLIVTAGGKDYVMDGHHRIEIAKARGASILVERIIVPLLKDIKALSTSESPVHAAADRHIPAVSVAFRYAFAIGRRVLKATRSADKAADAVREALDGVLVNTLLKVVATGGEAGVALLGGLKTAGGPGSGNFGHAGRPGEVGGSVAVAYHGTGGQDIIDSILKEGLRPDIGVGAGPSRIRSVYMTSSRDRAERYADPSGSATTYGGMVAVFEVHIPASEVDKFGRTSSMEGATIYSYVDTIPPEWIKGISTKTEGGKWSEMKTLAQVGLVIYVAIRFDAFRSAKDDTPKPVLRMKFNASHPQTVKWAKKHAAELVTQVTDTTRERIRAAVATATEGGDWNTMLDTILASVGDDTRADLIARHETMQAASEGQRLAWDQAVDEGLLTGDEQRVWIVTPDEKLCEICEPLDGAVTGLDGQYPGEGGDGPPAHIQCRCTEGITR